jgi:large subunit ribosomal protein L35
MRKQKTHKGLKKRVKVTARGKVVRKKSFGGHLMSHKSGRRCQRLRKPTLIVGKTADNIKQALGEA